MSTFFDNIFNATQSLGDCKVIYDIGDGYKLNVHGYDFSIEYGGKIVEFIVYKMNDDQPEHIEHDETMEYIMDFEFDVNLKGLIRNHEEYTFYRFKLGSHNPEDFEDDTFLENLKELRCECNMENGMALTMYFREFEVSLSAYGLQIKHKGEPVGTVPNFS